MEGKQYRLPTDMHGARFSEDRAYRYSWWDIWDVTLPVLTWVMLNPSKGDEHTLDATIRRCKSFARRWGYGGIVIVNLYAFVSTDPSRLSRNTDDPIEDPVGPENDAAIAEAAKAGGDVMVAWGANADPDPERVAAVFRVLFANAAHVYHLGRTASGQPCHPVRLANATERIEMKAPTNQPNEGRNG